MWRETDCSPLRNADGRTFCQGPAVRETISPSPVFSYGNRRIETGGGILASLQASRRTSAWVVTGTGKGICVSIDADFRSSSEDSSMSASTAPALGADGPGRGCDNSIFVF